MDKASNAPMKSRFVNVAASSSGMAVSPISLISEWRAHDALIISLAYISLADKDVVDPFLHENPAVFEKDEFILSAGMDQRVYLWDIKGRMIGVFGTDDWNVDDRASYRESEHGSFKYLFECWPCVVNKQSTNSNRNQVPSNKYNI